MVRTTLAGLRAHTARLVLAALATVIGVAFVAGTLVLGDTLKAHTERTVTANAAKVDVAVLATSGLRKLPATLPAELSRLNGVDRAQGVLQGTTTLLGRDGRPTRAEPVAASVSVRTEISRGRAPAADGEAALAEATARDAGFAVGDTVTVLDPRGERHRLRVTGLVDTAGHGELNLRGAVLLTPAATTAVTGETEFTEVYVGSDAVPAERLRTRVAAAVGTGGQDVLTGRQWADEKAAGSGIDPGVLTTGLLLFAAVALLVAALVIHTTFSILVAQRTRELALLRCVGASRWQVFGSVLGEAAAVGTLASALGLAAGIAAGYGAVPIVAAFGAPISVDTVAVRPATLIAAPLAGVVATVAAAALPARAATRIAPVAALNTVSGEISARAGAVRVIGGVLLCAAGLAVALYGGLVQTGPRTPLILVVCGGMVVFLGVVALGPLLIGPLARFVGAVPALLFGAPGRLAVANARRHPKRAAATTVALTVGVTLMTGFSVVTASFTASVGTGVERAIPVDYMISAAGSAETAAIPPSVVAELRGHPDVTGVAAQRETLVRIDGKRASIGTISLDGAVGRPTVEKGAPIEALGPDQIAIRPDRARQFGVDVGDTLTARVGGRTVALEVGALVTGDPFPPFYVTAAGYDAHFGGRGYSAVLVDVAPGLAPERARAVVEDATASHPTADILGAHDAKEQLVSTLSDFVAIVAGLLGLAVVVSLIGIANTMSLSVVERTRESAMLRALGLGTRQLRGMLVIEALILGVIGALVGVVLGVGFGLGAAATVRDDLVLALPVGQIALIVAGSGLAGMAAAVAPARRAARAPIAASLAGE
ncbi:putative ABC transport system permease protein [Murinocardiopsis flavida]|uniref:Putative ABC transport system permease protein n=1 Tax=Murinocardiopsis flavida TaxID=645275 RepID=A0A2P8DSQ7_9ACTN|nr:ABC transporter permease [Murinocardiopsis flavida]PSL00259.1 putative ABC transport system permease protein [Murinocardiopsis flavida]